MATATPKVSDPEFRRRMQEMMRGREFLAGQNISSINPESRTVDIIFFTGIDVPRMDWWTGEPYILRFDPKGADLSLLNNGAPVLDNHNSYSGSVAQKGVVERGWADGGKWYATLRFSQRASVDELWQDIQDKIVTKFSMGVYITKQEKFMEGKTQVRLARKWQPYELSVAPIPADFGTTTLAAEDGGVSRADAQKETTMSDPINPGTPPRADDSATQAAQSILQDQLESARQAGIIAELARVTQVAGPAGEKVAVEREDDVRLCDT